MKNLYKEDDSLVNLTPLIDVIFVILISFIVIAPFLNIEKVNLAQSFSTQRPLEGIKIYVKKNNSIWIDKTNIKKDELIVKLKFLKEKFPSKNIELYHDRDAYFGTYQYIKNSAEKAGFKRIDVVLKSF